MIKFMSNSPVQFKQKTLTFSGGELHPQLTISGDEYTFGNKIELLATIHNASELMHLALVKDAIDRISGNKPVYLILPYVPYARQDRVCNRGEAFGLKVFADMLNAMNFAEVEVTDPHSRVVEKLIKNVKVVSQQFLFTQYSEFQTYLDEHSKVILVAPDAGALEKTQKLAAKLTLPMIRATKTRDSLTGKLSDPEILFDCGTLQENVLNMLEQGYELRIVDDICDGGGTFRQLISEFHKLGMKNVSLAVTHGIFSRNAKQTLADAGFTKVLAVFDWTSDVNAELNKFYWKEEK